MLKSQFQKQHDREHSLPPKVDENERSTPFDSQKQALNGWGLTSFIRQQREPEGRGLRLSEESQVMQLQQMSGNRAVTALLGDRSFQSETRALQRDPDDYVEPSKKWYRVNDAFSKLVSKLSFANQRDPTVTRSQWVQELEGSWAKIGQPGERTDDQIESQAIFVNAYEINIHNESLRAAKKWEDLQTQYKFEIDRLERFPDVKANARRLLDLRYQETVQKVAAAGDSLVMEDVDGLNHMIGYDDHIHQAQEIKAREEGEKQAEAQRKLMYEMKLYTLSEMDLMSQINSLQGKLQNADPDSSDYSSMNSYLKLLEAEMTKRDPHAYTPDKGAYPSDIARFSSFLVRGKYIEELAKLLPKDWAKMSQSELTSFLSQKYTRDELVAMYLDKYDERIEIKVQFRQLNIISALVTGLIWARENIKDNDWVGVYAKVAGSTVGAYAMNELLYTHDKSAGEIMAKKAEEYGRWFQGAARSNKWVSFFVRDVGKALMLWDLKDLLMSGGGGGPNIPFDLIDTIDLNDPSTWIPPDQTLLDLGFNIWYRQACTDATPEACGPDLYLNKVEGSFIAGSARKLGVLPSNMDTLRGSLYQIVGEFDVTDLWITRIVWQKVPESAHVLVLATGMEGEGSMSGQGHYSKMQVFPANQAAVDLFGGPGARYVNANLLVPVELPEKERYKTK